MLTPFWSGASLQLRLHGNNRSLRRTGIRGKSAHTRNRNSHALGGTPGRIFRLMLEESLIPVLIGIAVGLTSTLGLARYLKAVLYGVSATDPLTVALAGLAMILTAVIAISIPARQASRVDPMVRLRHQ